MGSQKRHTFGMGAGADKKKKKKKNAKAEADSGFWSMLQNVLLAIIDRGHISSIPIILLCFVLLVLAWRIPEAALGQAPSIIMAILASRTAAVTILAITSVGLSVACVLLLLTALAIRRIYQREIDRQAASLRELQTYIDPNRPTSSLPAATAASPLTLPKPRGVQ